MADFCDDLAGLVDGFCSCGGLLGSLEFNLWGTSLGLPRRTLWLVCGRTMSPGAYVECNGLRVRRASA
jgi:hypothetical protein